MRRATSSNEAIAVAVALLLAPIAQAQKWTDRAEYDLVLSIRSETLPERRQALIDDWKKKYPNTELRAARAELDLAAAQELGSWGRVRRAARDLLAASPDSLMGLYWVTLSAPGITDPSAAELADSERAAKRLLGGLDRHFASSAMPAGVAAPDWSRRRSETEVLAHRTLGWIEWQRNSYSTAEQEFTICLQKDPQDAQASAWLGTVLALQKTPEKQMGSLWHLARAAYSDGVRALSGAQRQEVRALLEQFYKAFHGSGDGLSELGVSAQAAPFPPAGFQIETAAALAARRQEEEFARTNPELSAWRKIRTSLASPDGEAYFAGNWKDRTLPVLRGRVVRCVPARPGEICLSMADSADAEVRLTVTRPFPTRVEAGTELQFEASAVSFTREPFLLTVTAEREKIAGWPAAGVR